MGGWVAKLDETVDARFKAPAVLVDHAHFEHEFLDGSFAELAKDLAVRDLLGHLQTLGVSQ